MGAPGIAMAGLREDQLMQSWMTNLETIRDRCDQLCRQLGEQDGKLRRLAKEQSRKHSQYYVRN